MKATLIFISLTFLLPFTVLSEAIWNTMTSGTPVHLNGVAYGSGRFVACGDSGVIRISTDGQVWASATSNVAVDLEGIRYLNGAFYCVGRLGTILKSTDGITWSTVLSEGTLTIKDITYNSGSNLLVTSGYAGGVT